MNRPTIDSVQVKWNTEEPRYSYDYHFPAWTGKIHTTLAVISQDDITLEHPIDIRDVRKYETHWEYLKDACRFVLHHRWLLTDGREATFEEGFHTERRCTYSALGYLDVECKEIGLVVQFEASPAIPANELVFVRCPTQFESLLITDMAQLETPYTDLCTIGVFIDDVLGDYVYQSLANDEPDQFKWRLCRFKTADDDPSLGKHLSVMQLTNTKIMNHAETVNCFRSGTYVEYNPDQNPDISPNPEKE